MHERTKSKINTCSFKQTQIQLQVYLDSAFDNRHCLKEALRKSRRSFRSLMSKLDPTGVRKKEKT